MSEQKSSNSKETIEENNNQQSITVNPSDIQQQEENPNKNIQQVSIENVRQPSHEESQLQEQQQQTDTSKRIQEIESAEITQSTDRVQDDRQDDVVEEEEEVEEESHPLDELTDQQLIDHVNEIEMENLHLELENMLFENYLKENDPSLLSGIDDIISYFKESKSTSMSLVTGSSFQIQSMTSDKAKSQLDSYTNITLIAEDKGPKINLSHKADMVMRAMEESQNRLEIFLKKSHITKRNLKAELEELAIRESEIKDAIDVFEYNVVTLGLDKLTQRIPAEKFVRYMEEWLKMAQFQIEKLRLRIATSKAQYKKVSQQLLQRKELSANVHAVDFDQLEIENKHFINEIEQKNMHLLELKKMNGSANLILSIHKKYLQKQQTDYNQLQNNIKIKTKEIQQSEIDYETAEQQLDDLYAKYIKCKNLKDKYTVPEISEYINLKENISEIKRNTRILNRRKKLQDVSLNSYINQMKQLKGSQKIDPKWFEENKLINVLSE